MAAVPQGIGIRRSEVWAGLLLAWAGLSLLWTPDVGQGLFQITHAVMALAGFVVVSRLPNDALRYGLLPGVALTVAIHFWLLTEFAPIWYGGFGNKNFGAEFLMAAIPLTAVAFWQSKTLRYLGIAMALAGVGVLLTVYSAANAKYAALLALGLMLAGWLLTRKNYLAAAIVVLGPIDVAVLFGINAWTLSSLQTRIEIWTNTAFLWLERPLTGHGFGSYNFEYPRLQEAHINLLPDLGTLLKLPSLFAGSAHNDPLQLLAELGIVGLVLALGFCLSLIRSRTGSKQTLNALEWACVTSLSLQAGAAMVGFPFQNPTTIALAVLCLGVLARAEELGLTLPVNRWTSLSMAVPVAAFLVVTGWLHYAARVDFAQVKPRMDANDLSGAFLANLSAVRRFEWDWLPRYQLGLTLASLAIHDQKSIVEPRAADRLFESARHASPHSPALTYARIAYLEAAGRSDSDMEEIERLLEQLKVHAKLQPSTWMVELWFAERQGDWERAAKARIIAATPIVLENVGHEYPPEYRDLIKQIARETNELLAKESP